MDKQDNTYGNIETREAIMRKFYNCTQKPQELQALQPDWRIILIGVIRMTDTTTLKGVSYQSIKKELKLLATYKCETILYYDRFKNET